mmetsp:Transcript_15663/g.30281  ORF Transcript_15663/g.30281 Transcript_15663/m.30281 type:complete len:210 (-) Transcript_15663:138-767(-)
MFPTVVKMVSTRQLSLLRMLSLTLSSSRRRSSSPTSSTKLLRIPVRFASVSRKLSWLSKWVPSRHSLCGRTSSTSALSSSTTKLVRSPSRLSAPSRPRTRVTSSLPTVWISRSRSAWPSLSTLPPTTVTSVPPSSLSLTRVSRAASSARALVVLVVFFVGPCSSLLLTPTTLLSTMPSQRRRTTMMNWTTPTASTGMTLDFKFIPCHCC